jgi:hypothetical protein
LHNMPKKHLKDMQLEQKEFQGNKSLSEFIW